MINFIKEYEEIFLGTVRKYMQLRGGLSQKDLAEMTDTGISTMSRFLNQKTKELDAQMIAKIVAALSIPIYEMIDFVVEEDTDKFKKLVSFYKDEAKDEDQNQTYSGGSHKDHSTTLKIGKSHTKVSFSAEKPTPLKEKLEALSPRQKAYLHEFLEMDVEGRDLIVDLGNSIFRYFRQRGLEL